MHLSVAPQQYNSQIALDRTPMSDTKILSGQRHR
jgi:hypothetical protein